MKKSLITMVTLTAMTSKIFRSHLTAIYASLNMQLISGGSGRPDRDTAIIVGDGKAFPLNI